MKQTTITTQPEALTFRKVERYIRRSKNIDSSVANLLDELRGFIGNDNWREIPVYENIAAKYINAFIQETISYGTDNGQIEKLEALLFIIDKANEMQLKHGKDPLAQEIYRQLEERLTNNNAKPMTRVRHGNRINTK